MRKPVFPDQKKRDLGLKIPLNKKLDVDAQFNSRPPTTVVPRSAATLKGLLQPADKISRSLETEQRDGKWLQNDIFEQNWKSSFECKNCPFIPETAEIPVETN